MEDFKDISITPKIFAKIMRKISTGKRFSRKNVIAAVNDFYISHGGRIPEGTDSISQFKKACSYLKPIGLRNVIPGSGIWELNYIPSKEGSRIISKPQGSDNLENRKTIGHGSQSIYVFYYPTYIRDAKSHGETVWECKIGRTNGKVSQRIANQGKTNLPEVPVIGLQILTDNSKELEKAIHSVLEARGKKVSGSVGNEWYLTNPEDVENIYNLIEKY